MNDKEYSDLCKRVETKERTLYMLKGIKADLEEIVKARKHTGGKIIAVNRSGESYGLHDSEGLQEKQKFRNLVPIEPKRHAKLIEAERDLADFQAFTDAIGANTNTEPDAVAVAQGNKQEVERIKLLRELENKKREVALLQRFDSDLRKGWKSPGEW